MCLLPTTKLHLECQEIHAQAPRFPLQSRKKRNNSEKQTNGGRSRNAAHTRTSSWRETKTKHDPHQIKLRICIAPVRVCVCVRVKIESAACMYGPIGVGDARREVWRWSTIEKKRVTSCNKKIFYFSCKCECSVLFVPEHIIANCSAFEPINFTVSNGIAYMEWKHARVNLCIRRRNATKLFLIA